MVEEPRDQYLYADITAKSLRSGLSNKLIEQFHRVRSMRLSLDDCSFELRRIIYEDDPENPNTHILLRRNPPLTEEQLQGRTDGGRPPIALHQIDMDLRTVVCKGDVEVLTEHEMEIVRQALQRLLKIPEGQF